MSMSRAELQDAARKAFGESGLAPDAAQSWSRIAEMGWLATTVPEALGGLGLGREAAGAVHMEMGRALVPGPAIAQMMAIAALCAADDLPERDDLIARAMAGDVMTASAIASLDADRASHVLVIGGDSVALVPAGPATPLRSWDETRRLFDVALTDAERLVLASGATAGSLAARLRADMLFALAADSIGGASAILALTIDYLKMRRQFDRPLAMFQSLKHRCADLQTRIVAAEALLWSFAATASGDNVVGAGALKAHACQVYADVAEEAVQLHGGIGLTQEHHCHLFLKRALLNQSLGGTADVLEEAAGRRLLATETGHE